MRGMMREVMLLLAGLALFLVTRTFLAELYKIPTPSMQRTLMVGDFLVVDKLTYGPEVPFTRVRLPALRAPQRGDVIVFKWPDDPSINFVKRVVGVPGDTLTMRDGQLIRNGARVAESYVTHSSPDTDPSFEDFSWQRDYLVRSAHASDAGYWPSRNNWGPLVVPQHRLFVLGDNRDNSLDSRYWGFVPDSLVRGRPMFVYYSYQPDSADGWSWVTHARWRRLGTPVR